MVNSLICNGHRYHSRMYELILVFYKLLSVTIHFSFSSMQNGETAIHISSRHGYLKMVQELLEEGADPVCVSKVCRILSVSVKSS